MKRPVPFSLLSALFILLAAPVLPAAEKTEPIGGLVLDEASEPVEGVEIFAAPEEKEAALPLSMKTTENGMFIGEVPPG